MECLILPPHDGDLSGGNTDSISSNVMFPKDTVNYLYFVHLGSVNVYDRKNRFLVNYVSGSYFGDFQLFLGLKAQYRYVGAP